jgi:hypothetical protein
MAQLWHESGAMPQNTGVLGRYAITMILFFYQTNNSKIRRTVRQFWRKVLDGNLLYLSA